ncbi:MAG: WYL domain-containing protein, partial [Candidatus Methanomethylophilus sp.]|nr:WYL domain-containing protein [Methanomethylophilus sp.]
AMMILLQQSRSYSDLREKTLLFLTYSAAVVRSKYDFTALFMDALCYRIVETGLDWRMLADAPSLDLLCYKIADGMRFDRSRSESFRLAGKGKVECRDGKLRVCSSDVGEAGNVAFSVFDGRIEVVTRNAREEKLKSSEQDNVASLAAFADTFLGAQDAFVIAPSRGPELKVGDVVGIKVTSMSEDEMTLYCEVVDRERTISGEIVNEELVKGTWTRNLIPYVYEGDCIRGAVVVDKKDGGYLFSIRDSYLAYARQRAMDDDKNSVVMEAVVSEVKRDWYDGRIVWMTPSGYGGVSLLMEGRELKPGDRAVMSILNIQTTGSSMFVNLCPPKYGYESIDKPFESDDDVLADFVTTEDQILSSLRGEEKDAEEHRREEGTVRLLASVLANRAARKVSLNSYRQKLVSLFLSKTIGDDEAFGALLPETYYLQRCISFAQGNKVPPRHPYTLPESESAVLHMLSLWDGPEEELLRTAAALPADSVPGKIGALILGRLISSRFKDEVDADGEAVRKRICDLLGVGGLFRSGSSERIGKYGKTERQQLEFKSSYVFRNDGKGADIDYQGRGQVFEAVCGFLNAEGGTVYIGVNNDGDPIVADDSGLQADMAWLRTNYRFLNGMRSRQLGHAVNEVKDLDGYVQFLNSEKELYFKESLLGNIRIEVTEDVDAIRITVDPSEYEIAYLYRDKTHADGLAFVRDGLRTVEMSRVQKEQRLSHLKRLGKEMGFVVTIQEAIDKQGKLLFKGYSSGISGVGDRQVVPVNLFYNDENVYCYDLVSRKYKQFRLHRISSIETLPGTYSLQKSSPRKADVFRWLDDGGRKYHIRLRMDVAARNYLLEEYSCAEKLPPAELYEEKKNKWILDTHVNGLGAVRRFY